MARPEHGGNLEWASGIAGCASSELLDFSASISPLGPPSSVVEAIETRASSLLSAYPNPSYAALRTALGRHHGVDAGWVLPGNGSAELLTWAARDLAMTDRVYLMEPGFGDYERSLAAYGARIRPLALDVDGLFPEASDDAGGRAARMPVRLPNLETRDGILINNPHNPTGYLFEADTLRSLLQQGGLVVVDEAFMDFLPPDRQESVAAWVQDFPNLVVLRSLTKFYSLAGLRLGYALLHPDRAQRWQQWRDPWPVNSLAALAAEVSLGDEMFQQRTLAWLPDARQQLCQGLQALPGLQVYPGSANFLLVRSQVSSVQLQTQLLKNYQILIRDCMSFASLGDRFFRIAVRRSEENQRLLSALHAILSDPLFDQASDPPSGNVPQNGQLSPTVAPEAL